jgi:predicted MFS family arabinose efflux permease
MSANLFGAMCGGLLEYNSMYFGFQFLYLMAAGLYLLAFVWEFLGTKLNHAVVDAEPVSASLAGR